MTAIRRFALRLLSSFRPGRADAELGREIEAHLRLLEDDLRARGLDPADARAAARRAFGGVEQAKERHRDARGFRALGEWRLDLALGARMLVKHPALTIVGGLGIAVGVAVAVGGFVLVEIVLNPRLPFEAGDRIVSIQNWDAARRGADRRVAADFVAWREQARSVQHLAAFRAVGRNLMAPGMEPEVVSVAEMSASGFAVARVRPLVGRHLLAGDERTGAPRVVVLGHDVWRRRFDADPRVVGREIQLGAARYTVVGVMPEGFAFPLKQGAWVPLPPETLDQRRREGYNLNVFGRLAPGVRLESARAEFDTIGRRHAALFPDTHRQLRAQVLPFATPFVDMDDPENAMAVRLVQVLVTLLLIIVCANVAILVYARTARRQAEMAVRAALGATRARIVTQLFAEALVLAGTAAVAGLFLLALAFSQLNAALARITTLFPFWVHFELSAAGAAYAVAVTVLAAALIGAIPALKVTGRHMPVGLKAGTGASLRLGATWTALIVGQVTVAVALLPPAVYHAYGTMREGIADPGTAVRDCLTARLVREPADAHGPVTVDRARYGQLQSELHRRLLGEPSVLAATASLSIPGQESTVWIDVEGVPLPPDSDAEYSEFGVREGHFGHEARFNRVEAGFFDALGIPLLAGRRLSTADHAAGADAVVVNQALADRFGGAARVLGRRFRYLGRSGDTRAEHVPLNRWYEVTGVVRDFAPRTAVPGGVDAVIYHAVSPGELYPVNLTARVRPEAAAAFASRFRELTAAVDPDLQLRDMKTLDEALRKEQSLLRLVAGVLVALTLSVVLLSAAGISALMSFTVAQRRKEMAIRAALGADRRTLLVATFARALRQLALGAAGGATVAVALDRLTHGDLMGGHLAVVLPIVAVLMTVVGALAALGPARRGLRVQPTEALREE